MNITVTRSDLRPESASKPCSTIGLDDLNAPASRAVRAAGSATFEEFIGGLRTYNAIHVPTKTAANALASADSETVFVVLVSGDGENGECAIDCRYIFAEAKAVGRTLDAAQRVALRCMDETTSAEEWTPTEVDGAYWAASHSPYTVSIWKLVCKEQG